MMAVVLPRHVNVVQRLRPTAELLCRRAFLSSSDDGIGCRDTRRPRPRPRRAFLSSSSSSIDTTNGHEIRECGAWTLLAGLEKAKEADNNEVAHLVASLRYLLPQPTDFSSIHSQQHTMPHPSRSSDPAFFSLPIYYCDDTDKFQWTKQVVIDLLQASLRGRRIDLSTVEFLLKATTNHFRNNIPGIVILPKLKDDQQVTVVGDIHGSLTDLNTVLGLMGDPSSSNRVVFNGDLGDRGEHSIEVIAIVCALVLAFPDYVHVNRGNHEDLALSVAYGLATEVEHKYGTDAFRNMSQALDSFFRSLPLITVVEEDAMIVHAGPPPPGWTIASMQKQLGYSHPLSSRTSRAGDQKGSPVDVMVESCLWSDPDVDEEDGTLVSSIVEGERESLKFNSSRGAGFRFGAKIVKSLLEKEGLSRLVRSHEPVHRGCARYTVCQDRNMELFTVFSASRYPYKQGFNDGAILRLQPKNQHRIFRYSTEEDEPIIDSKTIKEPKSAQQIPESPDSITIRRALKEAIVTRRPELERAYNEAGVGIPFRQSMKILIRTLNLEGEGLSKPKPMLALARALTAKDVLPDTLDILEHLDRWKDEETEEDGNVFQPIISDWLKTVFDMVDSDHNDEIDKTEWYSAVDSINANMPEGEHKIDAELTWKLLDRNGDGHISRSEWGTLAAMTTGR